MTCAEDVVVGTSAGLTLDKLLCSASQRCKHRALSSHNSSAGPTLAKLLGSFSMFNFFYILASSSRHAQRRHYACQVAWQLQQVQHSSYLLAEAAVQAPSLPSCFAASPGTASHTPCNRVVYVQVKELLTKLAVVDTAHLAGMVAATELLQEALHVSLVR